MAKRMPPLNEPGHASCCFQMTAAEWRHWLAAGESLGSGLTALWRRAISLSHAADNEARSRGVSAADTRARGASS